MCRPSITVEGRKKKEKIKDKKSQRRRRLQKKKIKVRKLELATFIVHMPPFIYIYNPPIKSMRY
jgi:hypothetical protein